MVPYTLSHSLRRQPSPASPFLQIIAKRCRPPYSAEARLAAPPGSVRVDGRKYSFGLPSGRSKSAPFLTLPSKPSANRPISSRFGRTAANWRAPDRPWLAYMLVCEQVQCRARRAPLGSRAGGEVGARRADLRRAGGRGGWGAAGSWGWLERREKCGRCGVGGDLRLHTHASRR